VNALELDEDFLDLKFNLSINPDRWGNMRLIGKRKENDGFLNEFFEDPFGVLFSRSAGSIKKKIVYIIYLYRMRCGNRLFLK